METDQQAIYPKIDPLLAKEKAAHFGVSSKVHLNDYLMHFLFFKSIISNNEPAILNYYFGDAVNCTDNLKTVIDLSHRRLKDSKPEKLKTLEFASGYGRLTRHLVNDPTYELTCCDIHESAINFLTETFEVNTFLSALTPEKFKAPEKYDVVFALSFFSHIPKKYWKQWLEALFAAVSPGGLLIFTTHGQTSKEKHFPTIELDDDGFHFYADTDQEDIDMEFYGTTISNSSFVLKQLEPEMNLSVAVEGFWWGHQDVYSIRKS